MNAIVSFRLCKLTDEELIKELDAQTDQMFESQKVPVRHIPARPNSNYDLLLGELFMRFNEKQKDVEGNYPLKIEIPESYLKELKDLGSEVELFSTLLCNWTSVKEEDMLPEPGVYVMVYIPSLGENKDITVARIAPYSSRRNIDCDYFWITQGGVSCDKELVTHWQPMPAKPLPHKPAS